MRVGVVGSQDAFLIKMLMCFKDVVYNNVKTINKDINGGTETAVRIYINR